MTTTNHRNTLYPLPGILLNGLISGILLGAIDFYMGQSFAIISPRTYVYFTLTYLLVCLLTALATCTIHILILRIFKKPLFTDGIYFLVLIALYQFFMLNLKLTGWIQINNLRSLVVNGAWLLNWILLFLFYMRNSRIRNWRGRWFWFAGFTLTIGLTAYFQFYFMNWLSPPENKATTLLLLILLLSLPWAVIGLFTLMEAVFSLFSLHKRKWIQPVFTGIILISIPAIWRYPDLSRYKNPDCTISDLQAKNVRPNVIWIVMDTMRRDRMSCYGHDRTTTTHIDSLAKTDGILFTKYISTAPWTLPSHASMFTGLYSSSHGAVQSDTSHYSSIPLDLGHQTLAEILLENGYETRAYVANHVVLGRHNQLNQGFQFYLDQPNYFDMTFWGIILDYLNFRNKSFFIANLRMNLCKLSSEINHNVFHWLGKKHDQPFFLFINYMEAHSGFNYLPGHYDELYGFTWTNYVRYRPRRNAIQEIVTFERKITSIEQQMLYDLVDCKVTYLDEQIGHLVKRLKNLDLYDNSLIIFVSDHGTMLGEHYTFGHNNDLYEENIHVPLIIKYPDSRRKSAFCNRTIQTVDLMPEVLSVLDLPIPRHIQGQPVFDSNHTIVSELYSCSRAPLTILNPERFKRDLKALYNQKQYKFIQSSNNQSELYHLSADPEENRNLFHSESHIANKMNRQIDAWYQGISHSQLQIKTKTIDPKLKKKLKALGYIQ